MPLLWALFLLYPREYLTSAMLLSLWEVSATGVPCTVAADVFVDQAQGRPHHRVRHLPNASGTQVSDPRGAHLNHSLGKRSLAVWL